MYRWEINNSCCCWCGIVASGMEQHKYIYKYIKQTGKTKAKRERD
jgi:hypothetical protein